MPRIVFRERNLPVSEQGCENPDQRGDVALATQLADKPAVGTQGLVDGAERRTRVENQWKAALPMARSKVPFSAKF